MTASTRRFVVFGFTTTYDALAAEDALRVASLDATTVPRPAVLGGADCGVAVRVEVEDAQAARDVLDACGVSPVAEAYIEDRTGLS